MALQLSRGTPSSHIVAMGSGRRCHTRLATALGCAVMVSLCGLAADVTSARSVADGCNLDVGPWACGPEWEVRGQSKVTAALRSEDEGYFAKTGLSVALCGAVAVVAEGQDNASVLTMDDPADPESAWTRVQYLNVTSTIKGVAVAGPGCRGTDRAAHAGYGAEFWLAAAGGQLFTPAVPSDPRSAWRRVAWVGDSQAAAGAEPLLRSSRWTRGARPPGTPERPARSRWQPLLPLTAPDLAAPVGQATETLWLTCTSPLYRPLKRRRSHSRASKPRLCSCGWSAP